MARVTYGVIITNIQGSIGGVTFQSNKAGKIARLRPTNPKIPSTKQSTKTIAFSALAVGWGERTLPQKTLWNDFADANTLETRFGETKTLTGYNFYQAINSWMVLLGLAIKTVPAAATLPDVVTDYTVEIVTETINITALSGTIDADQSVIVFATLPVKTVSRSHYNKARLITTFLGNTGAPIDITADWEAAFGLDMSSASLAGNFNIGFMLMTVERATGMSSAGLFKTFAAE